MLAYETARQLRAAGVEVAGVILLDTWMRPSSRMWRWKIWMLGHIRTALKKGPGYVWKKFKERVEFEKDRIAAERELIRSGSFDLEVPWVVMERIYLNAMRRYRPQPLGCRGVVIESKEDWWVRANQEDPTLGARALFEGGVEVLQIPGNHLNIINRQSVTELARAYRDALRIHSLVRVPCFPLAQETVRRAGRGRWIPTWAGACGLWAGAVLIPTSRLRPARPTAPPFQGPHPLRRFPARRCF
jgi:thioesterase domain-containing protein